MATLTPQPDIAPDGRTRIATLTLGSLDVHAMERAFGREFEAFGVRTTRELAMEVAAGVSVAIVAVESLAGEASDVLEDVLEGPGPGAETPVIILVPRGRLARGLHETIERMALRTDVMLLERPMSPPMLTSAIRSAQRAKSRRDELREELAQRRLAEQRLRTRERQQAVIASLGRRSLEGIAAQDLMDEAVRAIAHVLDAPYAKVLELSPDETTLKMRAGVGWDATIVAREELGADARSQAGFTLLQRGPVVVDDHRDEDRFTAHALLRDHRVRSGISVPLGAEGRPWGVLGVHATRPGAFSMEDTEFLRSASAIIYATIRRERDERALRASEATLRQLADNVPDIVWGADPTGACVYVNKRWHEVTGHRDEEAMGWGWMEFLHTEDAGITAIANTALARGERYEVEYRLRCRDGSYKRFVSRGAPVVNDSGAVVQWYGAATDVTEMRRADAATRESEERLTSALRAGAIGTWRVDFTTMTGRRDPGLNRILGLEEVTSDAPVDDFFNRVHPEDRERCAAHWNALRERGEEIDQEFRIIRPDGSVRWVHDRGRAIRDDNGAVVLATGAAADITEQKRAEERIALERGVSGVIAEASSIEDAAETMLDRFIEHTGANIAELWLPVGGELTLRSRRAREHRDTTAQERDTELLEKAMTLRAPIWRTNDSPRAVARTRIAIPLVSGAESLGAVLLTAKRVMTEDTLVFGSLASVGREIGALIDRTRASAHRDALVAELNHRVKNTLALVQSIAANTSRNTESVDDFLEGLEGRLHALAVSHRMLTETDWRGGDLRSLVHAALRPFLVRDMSRRTLEGERVLLDTRATQSLAMILHELASNAAKYGALSNREGAIRVSWKTEVAPDGAELVVVWEESGGPEVKRPTRRGSGTSLVERTTSYELQGEAELDFRAEGVRCTLRIPLDANVLSRG
jgi:PAS domain S-box-containing protein